MSWAGALAVVAGLAVVFGLIPYVHYRLTHSLTDDAFVESHLTHLGAQTPGLITRVLVEERDTVKAGQLLAEIDPEPHRRAFELAAAKRAKAEGELALERSTWDRLAKEHPRRVDAAKADFAYAEAGVSQAKTELEVVRVDVDKAVREAEAAVTAAKAVQVKAAEDATRYEKLFKQESVPKVKWEDAVKVLASADADVQTADAKLDRASSNRRKVAVAEQAVVVAVSRRNKVVEEVRLGYSSRSTVRSATRVLDGHTYTVSYDLWRNYTVTGSDNLKIIRFWRDGAGTYLNWYASESNGRFYAETKVGPDSNGFWAGSGTRLPANEWAHVEFVIQASPRAGVEGRVSQYVNGRVVASGPILTHDDSGILTTDYLVHTVFAPTAAGTPLASYQVKYDNVLMTDQAPRIVLADVPVLAQARSVVNMIPTGAGGHSVTFQVDTGKFKAGDSAWVFYTDPRTGETSQGFAVQIGGTSAPPGGTSARVSGTGAESAAPPPYYTGAAVISGLLVLQGSGVPGGWIAMPAPPGSLALFTDVNGDSKGDVIVVLPSLIAVLDGQTGRFAALSVDLNGDGVRDLQVFNPDGTTTTIDGRTGRRI